MKEQLELETKHGGVTQEVRRLRDQAVRVYLPYLVRITIFIDKNKNVVDLST